MTEYQVNICWWDMIFPRKTTCGKMLMEDKVNMSFCSWFKRYIRVQVVSNTLNYCQNQLPFYSYLLLARTFPLWSFLLLSNVYSKTGAQLPTRLLLSSYFYHHHYFGAPAASSTDSWILETTVNYIRGVVVVLLAKNLRTTKFPDTIFISWVELPFFPNFFTYHKEW